MVDRNVVAELESDGMSYKHAFQVANLMEVEGIEMSEAKARVAEKESKEEKKKEVKDSARQKQQAKQDKRLKQRQLAREAKEREKASALAGAEKKKIGSGK